LKRRAFQLLFAIGIGAALGVGLVFVSIGYLIFHTVSNEGAAAKAEIAAQRDRATQ
jgi:hypothetical protein